MWGLYDFVNSKECESMTFQGFSILQYTWCMLIVGVQCLSMKNDLNPTYNHLLVWDWKWSKEPLTLFLPLKFCSRHSDFSRSGNLCPFYQSGIKCGKQGRHIQTWDLSKKNMQLDFQPKIFKGWQLCAQKFLMICCSFNWLSGIRFYQECKKLKCRGLLSY